MKSEKSVIKFLTKSIMIILCFVFVLAMLEQEVTATQTDYQKEDSIQEDVNQSEKETSGLLIIKYQDKEGNSISEDETKQGRVGDEYQIARKNIAGYKAYGVTPKEAKGSYTQETIEVIFVYQKIKTEEVVIKYVDEEGNYIRRDKTIIGNNGDSYEAEAAEVDGYKVTKTDGEEKGQIKEEAQEITYTYKKVDKNSKKQEWTTEKTLFAIAGVVIVLIIIFVIIAKVEKKSEKKEKTDQK